MPKVKCMNCKYGWDTRDLDKRRCMLELPPYLEGIAEYGNRNVPLDHGCDLGVEKERKTEDAAERE